MEIVYQGKRMPIVRKFQMFTREEFCNSEKDVMADGKGYLFILCSIENEKTIKNVSIVGATTSKMKLIQNLASVEETHVG